ncbi:MAG: hypothetical protein MZV70_33070 [Desulfobacterales bacterium]|nr:hypothetical protein [Desulfobacterales bacterium]
MRESIVTGDAAPGEREEFASLRPLKFCDYIGQGMVVDNLRVAVQAAREPKRGPLTTFFFTVPRRPAKPPWLT